MKNIFITRDQNEATSVIDNEYAELGYEIFKVFHGESLMTNALKLILNHMEPKTHRDNLKARKLVLRNGFTLLGDVIDDNNLDNVVYEYKIANNKT